MLPPTSVAAALHKLVGLAEVKAYAQNLKDATTLEKERGDDPKLKIFSCVLTGNPGTGKTSFAQLYGELLGELRVVPAGAVWLTGAQLQDGGLKGVAEVLETFDEPGDSTLEVGDTVEVRRNGEWGNLGRIATTTRRPTRARSSRTRTTSTWEDGEDQAGRRQRRDVARPRL